MYSDSISSSSSPRSRRRFRSTICGGFCSNSTDVAVVETERMRTSHRSPYTWLKSTAHELEVKEKCLGLIARIGAKSGRKHHSADFSYDPFSYALNFEDDHFDDAEFHPSFASRLPSSPLRSAKPNFVRDTTAVHVSKETLSIAIFEHPQFA
ncbi:uncharacterized protein LOC110811340 [Carica papaya]|uniref:uncharacterized protein LOC110811340 n=1 Tax=Carica papaya TaxID=3649 RepID=UPI000B8CFDDC|nr:uncharacterized protein LOC110811340 [Carica papaya]